MVVAELAGFIKEPSKLVRLSFLSLVAVTLEQFSIDCCKTKTKVVKTVNTQDLLNNSPNCLSSDSHYVSLENLVLDQLVIP